MFFINRNSSREWLLPAAVYTLFWLLFFMPVLASGRLLAPGDAWLQSVPAYLAGWQTWTPYLMGGFPVAADPSTMSLYPLLVVFQLSGVPWNLFVISAYLIAACSAYCWIQGLTGSRAAAWVAGFTYSMSGFMIVHLQHVSLAHAAAWAPLMLWGVNGLRRGSGYTGFVGLTAGATMMWLAGHPQIALYGSGLAAVYAWALLVTAPAPLRWQMLRWGLAAMGATLLLTAVFWLPVFELAQTSGRAAITLDYFLSYSLNPRDLIQLFFPMLWGGNAESFYQIPFFGGETHAGQGFVGYLPWLLALAAWWLYPSRRQLLFWSMVAVVSTLLALGGGTPVGEWMFHVPGYNMFRVPARNLLEFTLAMTALAGFGVAAIEQAAKARRFRVSIRAAIAVCLGIAASAVTLQLVESQIAAAAHKWMGIEGWSAGLENPAVMVPLLSTIVVATVFVAAVHFSREVLLFPVAVVAGLFGYVGFSSWKYDAPGYMEMPVSLADMGENPEWRILGAGRAWGDEEATSWPRVWRLQAADGYNPLSLSDYRKMLEITPFGSLDQSVFDAGHHALDIWAVRYIYAEESQRVLLEAQPERFKQLGEHVWLNRRALPRARLVREALPATKDEALRAIRAGVFSDAGAFDAEGIALVEESVAGASYDMSGSVEWMIAGQDELVLKVNSEGRALLLLADTYYPGWSAEIDGNAVPLLRANLTGRAVEVPAGEHQVRFFYMPARLYAGGVLSGVGLLIMLVLVWIRRSDRISGGVAAS